MTGGLFSPPVVADSRAAAGHAPQPPPVLLGGYVPISEPGFLSAAPDIDVPGVCDTNGSAAAAAVLADDAPPGSDALEIAAAARDAAHEKIKALLQGDDDILDRFYEDAVFAEVLYAMHDGARQAKRGRQLGALARTFASMWNDWRKSSEGDFEKALVAVVKKTELHACFDAIEKATVGMDAAGVWVRDARRRTLGGLDAPPGSGRAARGRGGGAKSAAGARRAAVAQKDPHAMTAALKQLLVMASQTNQLVEELSNTVRDAAAAGAGRDAAIAAIHASVSASDRESRARAVTAKAHNDTELHKIVSVLQKIREDITECCSARSQGGHTVARVDAPPVVVPAGVPRPPTAAATVAAQAVQSVVAPAGVPAAPPVVVPAVVPAVPPVTAPVAVPAAPPTAARPVSHSDAGPVASKKKRRKRDVRPVVPVLPAATTAPVAPADKAPPVAPAATVATPLAPVTTTTATGPARAATGIKKKRKKKRRPAQLPDAAVPAAAPGGASGPSSAGQCPPVRKKKRRRRKVVASAAPS